MRFGNRVQKASNSRLVSTINSGVVVSSKHFFQCQIPLQENQDYEHQNDFTTRLIGWPLEIRYVFEVFDIFFDPHLEFDRNSAPEPPTVAKRKLLHAWRTIHADNLVALTPNPTTVPLQTRIIPQFLWIRFSIISFVCEIFHLPCSGNIRLPRGNMPVTSRKHPVTSRKHPVTCGYFCKQTQ